MQQKPGSIFDGDFSYAIYETKSAPAGMKHTKWTAKRDPLNPTPPSMPSVSADIREHARNHAICHMQPYNHVSYAIEIIRSHTDKSPTKIKNPININNILNNEPQFGPLLTVKKNECLSEDDSEIELSETSSDESEEENKRLTEPDFNTLPDNVFASINLVKYVSFEASLDAALNFARKKIVVLRNAENIKAYQINTWHDVNHLSFREADHLFKMILCEISGQTYTADQLERATSRILSNIYGKEIMPVFIMLIFHLVNLSSRDLRESR